VDRAGSLRIIKFINRGDPGENYVIISRLSTKGIVGLDWAGSHGNTTDAHGTTTDWPQIEPDQLGVTTDCPGRVRITLQQSRMLYWLFRTYYGPPRTGPDQKQLAINTDGSREFSLFEFLTSCGWHFWRSDFCTFTFYNFDRMSPLRKPALKVTAATEKKDKKKKAIQSRVRGR